MHFSMFDIILYIRQHKNYQIYETPCNWLSFPKDWSEYLKKTNDWAWKSANATKKLGKNKRPN